MTPGQRQRYARQIRLPDFGEAGQQRLLDARVLIVGLGGLGSPVAMYLAASGVGELVLSDYDRVEASNLQRQIVHREQDIGEPKAESARRTLAGINPGCRVEALDWQLDEDELDDQLRSADLVIRKGFRQGRVQGDPWQLGGTFVITVNPVPLSDFVIEENHEDIPGQLLLENLSEQAVRYEWDLGNGDTSQLFSPVVRYEDDGTYLIELIAFNEFNCPDTAQMALDVPRKVVHRFLSLMQFSEMDLKQRATLVRAMEEASS